MKFNLLATFSLALIAISSHGSAIASPSQSKQPNVVIVITDDQGYGDLAVHGNPFVKTPNIDQLAKESISLTNYHVAPTCAPSRAGFITGRWNNRTGVWHTVMGRSMLREDEITIADLLKVNGYQTAMFGKWHLGDNYPYRPNDRGFDFAYYHGGGGVGQTPDHWGNNYFNDVFSRNGVKEQAKGFVTDVLFNEAIAYIETAKKSNKPFFTYISTNAPHAPMRAPKKYADMYAGKKLSNNIQHFYGMITNIDDNVQRLRNYLAANNLTDNTIFIFTTDNGSSHGHAVYNANMRGKKGSQYEGGHRVPFFIHWPNGKLPQNIKVNTITSFVDIAPTLLDLTNSTNSLDVKFDGISIKPLLTKTNKNWPNRTIFTDSQRILNPKKWRKSAVMTQQWRLIDGKELYDINKDPSQTNNVIKANPEVAQRLTKEYENWWQDIKGTFGEPTPIHIGDTKANPVSLTAHDWLGDNAHVPYSQGAIVKAIREKDGNHKGYWSVDVKSAGKYTFKLRRWPSEVNKPITSSIKVGKPLEDPNNFKQKKSKAFKAVKASMSIATFSQTKAVSADDSYIEFELELAVGKEKLVATFLDEKAQELGAFYVDIEKVN
jgi:arylsulfatase A-like enzyme